MHQVSLLTSCVRPVLLLYLLDICLFCIILFVWFNICCEFSNVIFLFIVQILFILLVVEFHVFHYFSYLMCLLVLDFCTRRIFIIILFGYFNYVTSFVSFHLMHLVSLFISYVQFVPLSCVLCWYFYFCVKLFSIAPVHFWKHLHCLTMVTPCPTSIFYLNHLVCLLFHVLG